MPWVKCGNCGGHGMFSGYLGFCRACNGTGSVNRPDTEPCEVVGLADGSLGDELKAMTDKLRGITASRDEGNGHNISNGATRKKRVALAKKRAGLDK